MTKLPESEQKHLALLNNPLVGVYQSTLKGRFLYVNQVMADMLGYASPEELMRVKVPETYANPANRLAFIEQLKKNGSVNSFENQLKTKTGQVRHVLTSGTLDNEIISGVIMDVTEHKDIEKKLVDSESRYRTIVEGVRDVIYSMNTEGIVTFISANVAQFGYSPDKIIGRNMIEFIHPDDAERVLSEAKRVFETGDEFLTKFRFVSNDGKAVWAEEMNHSIKKDGRVTGVIGVLRDITERKQMENDLRANEERYRTIVDNTENLITWVDRDGKFMFVNHAAKHILGLKPEACVGKSAFDFIHPDDKQATMDAFQKWLSSKDESAYLENRQLSVKGAVTHMSWIIKAFRDEKKRITGFLSVAHDITRRKRAAEALLESQRQIEFIIGAAHTGLDIIDHDFNLRYVDPESTKTYGAWAGRKCHDYFMKRSKPCLACDATEAFATKKTMVKEGEMDNGSNRYSQVTSIPYQDKNGEWLVAQVNVDITERKKTSEALAASELRYRRLFEAAKDGILILDFHTGQIVDANKFLLDLLGFSLEQLLGKELWQVGFFKDIVSNKEKFQELQRQKYIRYENLPLETAQGKKINVEFVSNVYDVDHTRVIQCNIRDITERKQAEERLKQSEHHLMDAQSLGKIGNWDFDIAANKLEWSDEVYKIYDRDKNLGPPTPNEESGYYAPEEARRLRGFARQAIEKGDELRYDTTLTLANGRIVFLSASMRPIKDDRGKVVKLFGTVQDITERKKAEVSLRQSEEHFRSLFNNMINGFAYCQMIFENNKPVDFIYLNVNRAFENMTGLKGVVGRKVSEVIPGIRESNPELFEIYGRVALTGRSEQFEIYVKPIKMWFSIAAYSPQKEHFVAVFDVITERKQAEELLVASEARFKTFFSNAPIGMAILNIDGSYAKVNESFCAILGYTPEEFYKIGYQKVTHPDDAAISQETIDLLLSKKIISRNFNKRYYHKNGAMVWTELNTSLLRDAAGQPLYFIVQVKDITERKQAEESLKMQAELLDSSTDSIILHDDKGRFVYANKATYQTRGYTKEEFMTMTLAHLDTPECAKLIESRMKQIKETGRARFDVDHLCKDGSLMPVEVNSSAIKLGGKPYFLAVMRDTTAQRQSQEQTRRASDTQAAINTLLNLSLQDISLDRILNETLDIILSVPWLSIQSRGAIFLMDETSRKLEMKMQRGLDQAIQQACANLELGRCLCGKAAMEQKTQFAKSVDKNHVITYEGIIPHGHYCVPIHTRDRILGVINIYLKDGHSYSQKEVDFLETIAKTLAGIISRQEIVREKEGVQSQLLQAQKMEAIGFLSGGIAHDFNNILAAVRGYAELSLMDIDKANPLYENLAHVVSASDRGKNLTNQLLLFSRKKSMNLKACDLNEIIDNLLKMLNRLIGENFHIEPQLEKIPWRINADVGNLEQVIMNLALNARDAMPKGGKITIQTGNAVIDNEYCKINLEARPGNFVCLSLADTGIGMTHEVLSHIFDPFFTTKEQGKGTGLGLSVVYGIVKQHQGWIEVDSKPDKGSVFKIYLPASVETAQRKPETRIISPADYKGNRERILVVEDDADVRKLVISVLGRMNYQVFPAGSLAEARQVFDKEKGEFHMILSDMSLPDGNGLEICDELTARNKNIKIILSSGYPSREENRDIIRERGLPFIAKPYNLTLLFKTVRDVLESK